MHVHGCLFSLNLTDRILGVVCRPRRHSSIMGLAHDGASLCGPSVTKTVWASTGPPSEVTLRAKTSRKATIRKTPADTMRPARKPLRAATTMSMNIQ
jgi:hypothetical protein